MFCARYFASAYFAPRYFSEEGADRATIAPRVVNAAMLHQPVVVGHPIR